MCSFKKCHRYDKNTIIIERCDLNYVIVHADETMSSFNEISEMLWSSCQILPLLVCSFLSRFVCGVGGVVIKFLL